MISSSDLPSKLPSTLARIRWMPVRLASFSSGTSGPVRGNVTTGSDNVNGYPMSWTVSGTNLEQIDLSVDHPSLATGAMIRNTLTLYLTN